MPGSECQSTSRRCVAARATGLEYSLQAALSLSRLKPELHAWFGVQSTVHLGLRQELEEIGPELADAPAAHPFYLFQGFEVARRGLGDDLQQGPRKDHTHMKSKFLRFDLPPRLETLKAFSRFMRRGFPRRARPKHEKRRVFRQRFLYRLAD